ncbi:DUF6146 family protein [Cesiribacter sp. SM1]|uniref:DUF6146 family protein n=1 Tax=Cesiribacter sp. SM1 TaxID=2861196 RepID=UPI001CD1E343|nr:DUF6146 family protein [Cesiribacter sp. SM1]
MKLRLLAYISIWLLVATACASGGVATVDKPASPNLVSPEGEEDEYELTIIDPGFERWFALHGRPVNYYTPTHYEQRNKQYVIQWNSLVSQRGSFGSADFPFENYIDYRMDTDYGLELNYELYWYFRYIESLYGRRYGFGLGGRNS